MPKSHSVATAVDLLLATVKALFPPDCWPSLWLVGGAVRDALLGKAPKDLDLITTLSEPMLQAYGYRLVVGKSTGPLYFRVVADGRLVELTPLTSARDIDDDLRRRDFTLNAIALALTGEIIDPCNGLADLQVSRLRVCSDTALRADPLRLVRACRFGADGWEPDAALLGQLHSSAPAALAAIPAERFSREFLKGLQTQVPAYFAALLAATPAGAAHLPELYRMAAVPAGPPEKHPEGDLQTHAMQVLERVALASVDPLARFCALFHDLGKLATEPTAYPRHHGHEEAGAAWAPRLCQGLRLPTAYGRALAGACRLHGAANRWPELRVGTRLCLAEQARKSGVTTILPLLAGADKVPGVHLAGWEHCLRAAALSATDLGIDPDRLLRLPVAARPVLIRQQRLRSLRNWLRVENCE